MAFSRFSPFFIAASIEDVVGMLENRHVSAEGISAIEKILAS
ncbi:MAG: hypothetical protein ACRCUG_04185 [Yersinia sp. (in: enterobacteria)]